ncbi:flagellar basal body P-ring formation chaperone FlgA [bacterium]|nr:flagellar basal body P-ring formation chaperone FlgA [bacterium]
MLAIGILFYSLFSLSAETPAIYFKTNSIPTEQRVVYLRDVADVTNMSAGIKTDLEEITLALSPEDFQKMSRHQLVKRLRGELEPFEQSCQCQIQLVFAREVSSEVTTEKFTLSEVRSRLEQSLRKSCEQCLYQISEFSVLRGLVPENYKHWDLQEDMSGLRGASMLRIYFDEQVLNPLVLQTWVRVQRPVIVVNKMMEKGKTLHPTDYEIQMRDVTNEQKIFVDVASLQGKELKRSLNKSQMVALEDLTDRLSVKIGDGIAIEIKNGAISVEMMGVALRSGKIGERVPVRITKTQKQITAEIVGESRVRL